MYRVALCACVVFILLEEALSVPTFNFGGDWFGNNNNKNDNDNWDKYPYAKKHVEKQLHIHGHRHHHHHHHHHSERTPDGDSVHYSHHSTDDISLPEIKNFEKALFESSNLPHIESNSIIPHESNSIISAPHESNSILSMPHESSNSLVPKSDSNPGLSSYRFSKPDRTTVGL